MDTADLAKVITEALKMNQRDADRYRSLAKRAKLWVEEGVWVIPVFGYLDSFEETVDRLVMEDVSLRQD